MKKLLTVLLGVAFVLAACGGDDGNNGDANLSEDASNGEAVYQASCVGCHGGNLGGASGPAIAGLNVEDILAAIEEGPGKMPAGLIGRQDAEDVADWISKQ